MLESLFGVKYLIHHEDKSLAALPESYEKLWQEGTDSVWKNPYALPLAFITSSPSDTIEFVEDPFENQNRLVCDLTGMEEPIFLKIPVNISKQNETMYAVFEQPAKIPTYFSSDGAWFSLNRGSFEKLGRFIGCVKLPETAQAVQNELRVALDAGYLGGSVYVSALDEAAFERAHALLSSNGCQIEHKTDSHLLIQTPEADASVQLVLTLPYDEGWNAFVDGAKVTTSKRYESLLAVDLPAGSHNVELRFTPEGFKAGAAISISSLLILLGWIWIALKYRKRTQK